MSFPKHLASSKEVSLPQGTIRYRERGTGEPIVFIHGALVNGDLWRKVVPQLAKDFRCIAPDLPLGSHERADGPGRRPQPAGVARLIADFLEALDLENVTLVGNDTGGALCQIVVDRPPGAGRAARADELRRLRDLPAEALRAASSRRRRCRAARSCCRSRCASAPMRSGCRSPTAGSASGHPEREVTDGWVEPGAHERGRAARPAKFLRSIDKEQMLAAARKLGDFERPVLLAWARRPVLHAGAGAADRRGLPGRAARGVAGLATPSCRRTSPSGSPS